jgi:hypothetical protein
MFSSNTTQVSDGGYQISRSLRFNSADSTYLVRTPSSNGSQTTSTASLWVKRSVMGAEHRLIAFDQGGSGTIFWLIFNTSNQLQIYTSGTAVGLTTTQVFRDPSAWYHIVVGIDTTQATSSNRIKLYVNGSQITAFTGTQTYYSLNATIQFNNTGWPGQIGYSNSNTLSGYMTEFNWIDGTQLTPSSFGETDTQTGVWKPKAYSGSYGTNGFYLNFSDNSNTTAATLGKDYSGNGNNWTPNGFSVSSGAGNDSLVDVPTSYGVDTGVGGTVRGNYATLNPLSVLVGTTSNGNLDGDTGTTNGGVVYATMNIPNSGKWYWEYTQTNTGTSYSGIETVVSSTSGSISNIVRYIGDGTKQVDGTTSSYGASYGNTDTIGTAVDVDAGTVTFYKNGTSQGAITYATASINVSPSWRDGSGSASLSYSVNFGQRPFAYTAPSGFKALCTQNLPTPTIGATTATQAGKYFAPVLYTGTGANLAVTVGFQPDFIWTKSRSATDNQVEVDALRGIGSILIVNSTSAESAYGAFVSFDTNGFTKAAAESISGRTYVAWNWKANGSGSTNTAGSITSTASANTTSGFSVVTFTGNSTAGATIGHGLGVAPAMVIMKNRVGPDSWQVYHKSLPSAAYRMQLNNTAAADVENTVWNSTAPTSTVFSVGTNVGNSAQVVYCFAPVDGYSAFGSYVGNGSASGPFVYTGFRPAFLLIRSTGVESWFLFDTARGTYNDNMPFLQANTNGPEYAFDTPEIMSNGFKLSTSNSSVNGSGNTMIYAAFAETPFKYSLAR